MTDIFIEPDELATFPKTGQTHGAANGRKKDWRFQVSMNWSGCRNRTSTEPHVKIEKPPKLPVRVYDNFVHS